MSWNAGNSAFYIRGGIHVSIPLGFYYGSMARYTRNKGKLYGGAKDNIGGIGLANDRQIWQARRT